MLVVVNDSPVQAGLVDTAINYVFVKMFWWTLCAHLEKLYTSLLIYNNIFLVPVLYLFTPKPDYNLLTNMLIRCYIRFY